MDTVVAELAAQQAELAGLLDGLDDTGWQAPTRCEGWDVADVVLHLAQSDELAVLSATGRFAEAGRHGAGRADDDSPPATSVDEVVARLVDEERGLSGPVIRDRWAATASRLVDTLDAMDLSTRVPWVAGELSARSLATTRLAESWIHAGDVADALGTALAPSDRLRSIARLAWRTLPYAFATAGRSPAGPVAFLLTSPSGEAWDFLPDGEAVTTITGPAVDLCEVAARRMDPDSTALRGEGPDAAAVLALVRTYAT